MKDVYFQMLDFEGKIRDIDEFKDIGYVDRLIDGLRISLKTSGQPASDEFIYKAGLSIINDSEGVGFHHGMTGFPKKGSKASRIFYLRMDDESIDIWNRAHEEAHAVRYLGLVSELEQRIGVRYLGDLYEEDFCDQAGLYVLTRKGIKPHPAILVPYAYR